MDIRQNNNFSTTPITPNHQNYTRYPKDKELARGGSFKFKFPKKHATHGKKNEGCE